MSVTPSLVFGKENMEKTSTVYVMAIDGAIYKKIGFFNEGYALYYPERFIGNEITKASFIAQDPKYNFVVVYVTLDKKKIMTVPDEDIFGRNKRTYDIVTPTGVSVITSVSINDARMYITDGNGTLYYTDAYYRKTDAATQLSKWRTIKTLPVKKILNSGEDFTVLAFIGTDNKIYYDLTGYGKLEIKPIQIPDSKNVVDATTDGKDIWWVDSAGKIYCKKGFTGATVTLNPHLSSGGAIAIYVNVSTGLGYIGKDGGVYYTKGINNVYSPTPSWSVSPIRDVNTTILDLYSRTTLNYYGNSTPVKKPPYVITLNNVNVSTWVDGESIRWNGCGWSSSCGSTKKPGPGKQPGWAMESPTESINYYTASQGCKFNCWLYMCSHGLEANCWIPESCSSHVFGDTAGIDVKNTIPPNKDQYNTGLPGNALDLGITPFDKVYDDNYKGPHKELSKFNSKIKPTFKSLKFNIPDPTEPGLDAEIPNILWQYCLNGQFSEDKMNDYMVKYMFAPIVENGQIIPRIAQTIFTIGREIPKTPIDKWLSKNPEQYKTAMINYCSGDKLNTEWCYQTCRDTKANNCETNLDAFCQIGIDRKGLPGITKDKLTKTKITEDMLKKAYPKYFEMNKTCGCFMPDDFYTYYDQFTFQQMGLGADIYEDLILRGAIGGVGGGNCDQFASCGEASNIKRNSAIQCPSLNLQICKQNVDYMASSINQGAGASIKTEQIIDCKQQVEQSYNKLNPKPTSNLRSALQNADVPNATTKPTTKLTTKAPTKIITMITPKATTQAPKATTKLTTKLTTQAPKATTKLTTKLTTQAPTPTQAPKSNKTIIIIIIVMILLLAAGVGAFFLL